MKSFIVSGQCPYQLHQLESLRNAGVDAEIYVNWGIHLPNHVDALLAAEPDVIHLQWPESVTDQQFSDDQILDSFAVALPRLREAGVSLFWVMHNLLPHERKRETMWRALYQMFAEHCDVCCHHSTWGEGVVRDAYQFTHARHLLLRHGYFHRDVYPAVDQKTAREKLGLPADKTIYLNVGSLRPDKQIAELLDVFEGRDDWLVLAGLLTGEYGKVQADRADAMSNVVVHRGYTDDETVSLLANAANCFVFMQGDNHLTSGAPHLSQAHLLPQITLDYAYAREVLGEDAVYIPADGNRFVQLAEELDNLDADLLNVYRDNIAESREPWRWDVIGQATKSAYETALND